MGLLLKPGWEESLTALMDLFCSEGAVSSLFDLLSVTDQINLVTFQEVILNLFSLIKMLSKREVKNEKLAISLNEICIYEDDVTTLKSLLKILSLC